MLTVVVLFGFFFLLFCLGFLLFFIFICLCIYLFIYLFINLGDISVAKALDSWICSRICSELAGVNFTHLYKFSLSLPYFVSLKLVFIPLKLVVG